MSSKNDLQRKVEVNEEMISNLKEFFGSYLSNFLKEYRNPEHKPDDSLQKLLQRQDGIFEKFKSLMENTGGFQKEQGSTDDLLYLKERADFQNRIIILLKRFFTSNSSFIKLYRKYSSGNYDDMEKCLDEQDQIYENLLSLLQNKGY